MEMPDYVTLILSGVVAAVVTFLLGSVQKDYDYKNEYYKKIIEKRFQAYETLEQTLRQLNFFVYDEKLNGAVFSIFEDTVSFDQFSISLFEAQLGSRWLSPDTQNTLRQLSIIIAKISRENVAESASPYLSEVLQLKRNLDKSSLLDFRDLHDIETFFKPKKPFWQRIGQRKFPQQRLGMGGQK
jgi:hypothetical protein